ncbi:MAG: hypothetical protein LC122_03310 [Chitinophagales bacterium]|nr:hypothetical protein [Chitinophagales bacterium]
MIRYIIANNSLPASIPANISLENILLNMPYHMQHSLNMHLGTKKLQMVVLDKISKSNYDDSSTSEIETFLSIALYSDFHGDNFDKYLRKFIKMLNRSGPKLLVI